MSVVIVACPVIVATAMPLVTSFAAAAATALGYELRHVRPGLSRRQAKATVEVEQSELSSELPVGALAVLVRGDVTAEIRVGPNGRLQICMDGPLSAEELQRLGEELAGKILQQYAYHTLRSELEARGAQVQEEEVLEDQSIRLVVKPF